MIYENLEKTDRVNGIKVKDRVFVKRPEIKQQDLLRS